MVSNFHRKTGNDSGYASLTAANKLIVGMIFFILLFLGGLFVLALLMLEDNIGFFGLGHYVISKPDFLVDKVYRSVFITLSALIIYVTVCFLATMAVKKLLTEFELCTPDEAWDVVIFMRFPARFCTAVVSKKIKSLDPWFGSLWKFVLYVFFFVFIIDWFR
jgi:hypothetical protein